MLNTDQEAQFTSHDFTVVLLAAGAALRFRARPIQPWGPQPKLTRRGYRTPTQHPIRFKTLYLGEAAAFHAAAKGADSPSTRHSNVAVRWIPRGYMPICNGMI